MKLEKRRRTGSNFIVINWEKRLKISYVHKSVSKVQKDRQGNINKVVAVATLRYCTSTIAQFYIK